jgi:hypothetical protein
MLCYVMLYYIMLCCYVMLLCYVMLYYVMLYYIILYYYNFSMTEIDATACTSLPDDERLDVRNMSKTL